MCRLRWLTALVVAASLAGFVAADGISLVVELEGDLVATGDRFSLLLDGQRWTLELNQDALARAQGLVSGSAGAKVFVVGSVRGRMTESGLFQFPGRLVRVTSLEPGIPGVKITRVWQEYPAFKKLKEMDVIREVEGKPIPSFSRLIEVLQENRGKAIAVVVIRDGRYVRVPGIELATSEARLGIAGDVVWMRRDSTAAMAPIGDGKSEKIPIPKGGSEKSEKPSSKAPY